MFPLRRKPFFLSFPSHRTFHISSFLLQNFPQHSNSNSKPPSPDLLDRISRLLLLRRPASLNGLRFPFSDPLTDALLRRLRLHPAAALAFFQLASQQSHYRPHATSFCLLLHILARAKLFSEARSLLHQLLSLHCTNNFRAFAVCREVVSVYKEFGFSPTVFDMLLKAFAERGMTRHALNVFDEMNRLGRIPCLRSCNCLLARLVRAGEVGQALTVFEQVLKMGIVPDVFMISIVVNAHCREGNVDCAERFVEKMVGMGLMLLCTMLWLEGMLVRVCVSCVMVAWDPSGVKSVCVRSLMEDQFLLYCEGDQKWFLFLCVWELDSEGVLSQCVGNEILRESP